MTRRRWALAALALFLILATVGAGLLVGGRFRTGGFGNRGLAPAQGRELADAAWTALHDGKAAPELTGFGGWGAARIFVSGSDGTTRATTAAGAGDSAGVALAQALAEFRRTYKPLSGRPPVWIKVHVATGDAASQVVSDRQGLTYDKSLYALSFPELGGLTLLPEQTLAFEVVKPVDKQDVVEPKELEQFLLVNGGVPAGFKDWARAKTRTVAQFPVEAWFRDEAGPAPTFRGHRVAPDAVDGALLVEAVTLGARYLQAGLGDDGAFTYNYQPRRDAGDGDYNILRHAGTIYAMLETDQALHLPGLRAQAERALKFLEGRLQPCISPDAGALCLIEDDATKLGGNALALVAMAKHAEVTGSRVRLETMRRLALRIVSIQDPKTGELKMHKQTFPGGKETSFTSDYYPGESILGLMRLYALDGEPRWADAAAKAAHYLIDVRDAGKTLAKIDHDHWLLYGLDELWRAKRDPAFLEHAKRIVAAIVGEQNGKDTPEADWRGGWFDEPRGTPAATRAEGLMAAYRMFLAAGEPARAAEVLAAAKAAARFQLATQLREERVMFFPAPRRALGGFGESLTGYEVRIDYVQHNVSALLALRAALAAP